MDKDIIVGCIALFLALGILTYLVLCARNMVNKIGEKGPGSARKIMKEINSEK